MISDCQDVALDEFGGVYLPSPYYLDDCDIPENKGRAARNTQYFNSSASTRYGFAAAFSPSSVMASMVNWLFLNSTTPKNYLAWLKPGTGIQTADLSSPSAATVATETTSVAASLRPLGNRLYMAFMDANGIGVAPGQVYGFGVGADPLFAAPISNAPTFTELGSGFTTLGAKQFGYLIQTRNGYITRPSPTSGSSFSPTAYTSLGGAIFMSVDPPGHVWPDYALKVAPIMTTTANPNQFFIVPSPFAGQDPWSNINHAGATIMAIEVTDSYLESSGIDATPYLLELGQTTSGTAPIKPSVIFAYGQRLAYICLDSAGVPVCYFSDSSNYQSISAATSGVYLPGLAQITTGCAIDQTAFLFGPHWTYATTDNNSDPTTWAQPRVVSSTIGAAGPFCVSANESRRYAWVADESGLYYFDGQYALRPVSFWQSADWDRINFAAVTKVQVIDDTAHQRVLVIAPLDGATSPTHILAWDYSLGNDPETVQYSLWNIADYHLGCGAVVQNDTSKGLELWLGPSNAADSVYRQKNQKDTTPFRDGTASVINSLFETCVVPRGMAGTTIMAHGANLRVRGEGLGDITAYGLDHGSSAGPFTFGLSKMPTAEWLQRFYINSQYASVQIECNTLDSWFQLAALQFFYTPGVPTR